MKNFIMLVTLILLNNHLYAENAYDYKLSPKKVTENIWCFFGALETANKENAGNMVNSCYVKTKDSFVVIDSGPSYQYARQAYMAMSKIAKLPVKTVIVSHEHDDHWLGNNYYKEKFSATLIGPESIDENYKAGDRTRMFQTLPKNAIEGTKIIKLDQYIKKVTTLKIGGEVFEITPVGQRAHTSEDIFVYLPKREVMFAGDLVMNGRITSNRNGSVMGQLFALKMIKSKKWNVLIAGHGLITNKTAMDESLSYFSLLKKRVFEALDKDVEADKITSVVKMQEFKKNALYKELNARNVLDAFLELELMEEE